MCGWNVPAILSYPRYQILSSDRTSLLREGTICSVGRLEEHCLESLPPHGDFVFRAIGIAANGQLSDRTWAFCGVSGTIGEDLQFSMRAGRCVPSLQLSAGEVCTGVLALLDLEGLLRLSHAGGSVSDMSISTSDMRSLEKTISDVIGATQSVIIHSAVTSGLDLDVSFSVQVLAEDYGITSYTDTLGKELAITLQATFQQSFDQGAFFSFLRANSGRVDTAKVASAGLLGVSSASLVGLTVTDVSYVSPSALHNDNDDADMANTVNKSDRADVVSWTSVGASVVVMCTLLVVVAFIVAYRTLQRGRFTYVHMQLPEQSMHTPAYISSYVDNVESQHCAIQMPTRIDRQFVFKSEPTKS